MSEPRTELPTVAVVLAGGTGSRLGMSAPKQLLKVAGKPILEHTIAVFEESPVIDQILVLMAPGWLPEAVDIVRKAGFRKVSAVLGGGSTRNETTMIALDWVGDLECNLLFHDAVRPWWVSGSSVSASRHSRPTRPSTWRSPPPTPSSR